MKIDWLILTQGIFKSKETRRGIWGVALLEDMSDSKRKYVNIGRQ